MAEKNNITKEASELRRLAEQKADLSPENTKPLSPEETQQVLHELRVHQIELEMQNEELRRAQDELTSAGKRYFDLYNLAPVGYCTLSEKGVILEANSTLATLLGYARNALEKQPISNFILKEYQDICYMHRKQLFETLSPQTCELRMLKKDGPSFWAHLSAIAAKDADGAPICRVAISDITERKRAERYQALLSETLAILNNPAAALPDIINGVLSAIKTETGFDAVGIRLKSGDEFPYFKQCGFSNDFMLTENTLLTRDNAGNVFRNKDGRICLECACGLVISGKTDPANPLFTTGGSCWTNNSLPLLDLPADQDPRLHPRNRCIRDGYASVALIPIRTKQEIVGLLQLNNREKDSLTLDMVKYFEGMAANIGMVLMQKDTEASLQKNEQKYRLLFENAGDAIIVHDMLGQILEVNPTTCKRLDYTRAELISMTGNCIDSPEESPHIPDRIARLVKNGHVSFETVHRNKSGALIPTEVIARLIIWDGQQASMSICRDITSYKKADAVLRRSKKTLQGLVKEKAAEIMEIQMQLERSKRLSDIGTLSATVAHELRNPIAGMRLAAAIIKKKTADSAIGLQVERMEKMLAESLQIIDNLLFFSRLRLPRRKKLNVYSLLEECINALGHECSRKNMVISKHINSLKDVRISADPVQIKEVFTNVLNNAADAVPAYGGEIRVEARVYHDLIKVQMTDNGQGMARGILNKVFNPFFTTKAKGTGLGLTVCRQMVKMHEGLINIKSESGKGTSVVVTLPKKSRGIPRDD